MEMKLITSLALLVISLEMIIASGYTATFYVGGKNGWVVDPRESYNHWAERNRFQVNDTLVFKYKKGLDSVLVVNEEAYHRCDKTNPVETLNDGNSVFKFTRSGPFFFISGQDDKCENGEKLIIVVMAVRDHSRIRSSTTGVPTPAPVSSTPTLTPVPVVAPSTVLHGTDGPKIHAPASAPATSGVTSRSGVEGSIGLILCLISLVLKMF